MRTLNVLSVLMIATLMAWPTTVMMAQEELCVGPFLPVSTPLTDLGTREYVRLDGQASGFTGGLYPDGRNNRPPVHEAAGQAIAATIVPLNAAGEPDANGRIVMISVGMSNTSSEFNTFIGQMPQNPLVNPQLTAVNGAQGGRTADRWTAPDTDVWANLGGALHHAQVTPEQVQVAWIKQTLTRQGDFPQKAEELQAHLAIIVQDLKVHYPNLKIAYLSSRTRSYTYERGLSPEPVAFETAFAVKWLIAQQINGDPALNYDPARGDVVAPYLSWGPYLWIDGENARSDGRVWLAEDMAKDCTHPSRRGNQKVAEMLWAFFLTDSTAGWFRVAEAAAPAPTIPGLAPSATAVPPTPSPSPTLTNTPLPPATVRGVSPTAAPTAQPPASPTPAVQPATPPTASKTAVWLPLLIGAVLIMMVFGVWRRVVSR